MRAQNPQKSTPPGTIQVTYDGDCPLCRNFIQGVENLPAVVCRPRPQAPFLEIQTPEGRLIKAQAVFWVLKQKNPRWHWVEKALPLKIWNFLYDLWARAPFRRWGP